MCCAYHTHPTQPAPGCVCGQESCSREGHRQTATFPPTAILSIELYYITQSRELIAQMTATTLQPDITPYGGCTLIAVKCMVTPTVLFWTYIAIPLVLKVRYVSKLSVIEYNY